MSAKKERKDSKATAFRFNKRHSASVCNNAEQAIHEFCGGNFYPIPLLFITMLISELGMASKRSRSGDERS